LVVKKPQVMAEEADKVDMSVAGPSSPRRAFAYPVPTPAEMAEELPEYFADEDIALGDLLDRLVRKSYGNLRVLVEHK
jgi:hypothetical protein